MSRPRTQRQLVIDHLAMVLRKPTASPLLEPAEAIAVALSMIPYKWSGRILSDDSLPVRAVLQALDHAGYKIEPR
jgi:hypothetical protein